MRLPPPHSTPYSPPAILSRRHPIRGFNSMPETSSCGNSSPFADQLLPKHPTPSASRPLQKRSPGSFQRPPNSLPLTLFLARPAFEPVTPLLQSHLFDRQLFSLAPRFVDVFRPRRPASTLHQATKPRALLPLALWKYLRLSTHASRHVTLSESPAGGAVGLISAPSRARSRARRVPSMRCFD